MKVQTASLILLIGSLMTAAADIATVIGPQNITQHQATAELNGPGWKKLVEYLQHTETDKIEDAVTVLCVLESFLLGQQCRKFWT